MAYLRPSDDCDLYAFANINGNFHLMICKEKNEVIFKPSNKHDVESIKQIKQFCEDFLISSK